MSYPLYWKPEAPNGEGRAESIQTEDGCRAVMTAGRLTWHIHATKCWMECDGLEGERHEKDRRGLQGQVWSVSKEFGFH